MNLYVGTHKASNPVWLKNATKLNFSGDKKLIEIERLIRKCGCDGKCEKGDSGCHKKR